MPANASTALPDGAILAGNDKDNAPIYVGRAYHKKDLLPAKILPTKKVAYVSWGGEVHPKYEYDVLCNGEVQWVNSCNGEIPAAGIEAGLTSKGEILYVGRAFHEGTVTVGKIHPSHSVMYIPFDGQEIRIREYDALVEA